MSLVSMWQLTRGKHVSSQLNTTETRETPLDYVPEVSNAMSTPTEYALTALPLYTWASVESGWWQLLAARQVTKYVTAANPCSLLPCFPVTSNIAVCSILAVPLEPSWFPATLLHLPCLQRKTYKTSVRAKKHQTSNDGIQSTTCMQDLKVQGSTQTT